jgi:hypothetical protein
MSSLIPAGSRLLLLVVLQLLLAPAPLLSCPVCYTEAGTAVRATILGPGFWTNAAAAAAPFVILVGTALVLYGPDISKRKTRR